MEVCVDSVESAINAHLGGASRLELCCSLDVGGLTPSIGLLRVVKRNVHIPVFVMIRSRSGDFLYSDLDLEVMQADIEALKGAGADGFVLGLLSSDGRVDKTKSSKLIACCRPLPVTFHRAIDFSCDVMQSLDDVISLGCERVLTSGGHWTALEGASVIRRMIEHARGRIIVMAGSGVSESSLRQLLAETGATEFHGSARLRLPPRMRYHSATMRGGAVTSEQYDAYSTVSVADESRVRALVNTAASVRDK